MNLNLTLGSGRAVHAAHSTDATTVCGGSRIQNMFRKTDVAVTCKRCLKRLAAWEEQAREDAAHDEHLTGQRVQEGQDLAQADHVSAPQYVAVVIDGKVYTVGPEKTHIMPGGSSHVEYWEAGDHSRTRRAYADAVDGSLKQAIWHAQRAIRNPEPAQQHIEVLIGGKVYTVGPEKHDVPSGVDYAEFWPAGDNTYTWHAWPDAPVASLPARIWGAQRRARNASR